MSRDNLARVGEEALVEIEDQWLTIKEACAILRCSHMTIRRLYWNGTLVGAKPCGKILISKLSLTSFLEKSFNTANPGEKLDDSYGTFKLIDGGYQKIK